MPALSKWGGATVGLTLLAIGAMGLYETFFEHNDEAAHVESDPTAEALTGGLRCAVLCCAVLCCAVLCCAHVVLAPVGLAARLSCPLARLRACDS